MYNYYSRGEGNGSGDEVFEIFDTTPATLQGFSFMGNKGQYSWQKQESWKGRKLEELASYFLGTGELGWGFNASKPTTETATGMTDSDCRTAPLFAHKPSIALGDDAAAIREQRDNLLASGIPALSVATGRSSLSGTKSDTDCQRSYVDRTDDAWVWARSNGKLSNRWLHSDLKNVAYPFTKELYKSIVEQGVLK